MIPMNALILSASPNKNGLTAACAAAAQAGFRQAGLSAEIICLNDLQISRCQACDDGWGTCLNEHLCRVSDDFQALHAHSLQAGFLALVTPVYWGDLSESAKAFTDRLRRCEATRGAESGLRGKPVLAVAAAGGSGNGMITCLASLERWIEHLGARKFDFIAVNRWNRVYKLEAIRAAARALPTAEF
jgi:multimeric flavodoxin WrbA